MPSRPMSAARGLPIEAGLPHSSMLPLALAAPNSAWNSSRWPCPCSPPTPSTSPSRSAKLTPFSRLPLEKSLTLSAMRSVAVAIRSG